jgi:DNA-binding NarL/FixJ family response regulator
VKFLEQGFYFSSEHYMKGAMTRPVVTARQLEVLMLLDQGNSVKQIAAKLGLAPKTVERHTENVYRALNVSNARAACQAVRSLGLLRS